MLLTCRSSNEAPQESLMMQLSEEVAYLHQAYTLCLAMRDNLVAAMVASPSSFDPQACCCCLVACSSFPDVVHVCFAACTYQLCLLCRHVACGLGKMRIWPTAEVPKQSSHAHCFVQCSLPVCQAAHAIMTDRQTTNLCFCLQHAV